MPDSESWATQSPRKPSRCIQGGRDWVEFDGRQYKVRADVHTLSGYSAHADQQNLLDFVRHMHQPPGEVVLVHGEASTKDALKQKLVELKFKVR